MTIETLLEGIEAGTIALADFQRDFDWSGPAIRSLLATVLMGWPAGSLLAVAGDHPELTVRRFEGGPEPRKPVDLIILDGQQRLTALLHTVTVLGSQDYSVPLSALESGLVDDIEEQLRPRPADDPTQTLFVDPSELLIPLSAARTRDTFFSWRRDVVAKVSKNDRERLDLRLAQVYRDRLHWLHDHPFPVVSLDVTVEAAAVARIFERVNRTGLRLGSFDLVVARAYSQDWNLRQRWEEARFAFPLLDPFFGDDGLAALQLIALRKSSDVRQSAVLELPAPVVLAEWDSAVASLDEAIRFLASNCGVARAEWLPYRSFVLLLGALAQDGLLQRSTDLLRTYVFTRSFGLRFDAAANTRVVEDYVRLKEVVAQGEELPRVPARARLILGSTRQRQGAIYRAFLCLLAVRGAEDPAGRPIRFGDLVTDGYDPESAEAVTVSLVPRDDKDRLHLRTLAQVVAHPETALELRRRDVVGQPDAHARSTQLLPEESIEHSAAGHQLLEVRLELLRADLRSRFEQDVVDEPDV